MRTTFKKTIIVPELSFNAAAAHAGSPGGLSVAAIDNEGLRDDSLDHGFDAVLVHDIKDGQLHLYGISGSKCRNVVESHLSVDEAKDQKKFNIAARKVLVSLPVLAAP